MCFVIIYKFVVSECENTLEVLLKLREMPSKRPTDTLVTRCNYDVRSDPLYDLTLWTLPPRLCQMDKKVSTNYSVNNLCI